LGLFVEIWCQQWGHLDISAWGRIRDGIFQYINRQKSPWKASSYPLHICMYGDVECRSAISNAFCTLLAGDVEFVPEADF
jgi:hypothetical protein